MKRPNETRLLWYLVVTALTCGEKHHKAKITTAIVRAIRAERAAGFTLDALHVRWYERTGLSRSHIARIAQGYSWKHVEP